MRDTVLELENFRLAYGQRTVLTDVYLRLEGNGCTGILGRNGSGKTSMYNMLFGTLLGEGVVHVNGQRMSPLYQKRHMVAYLPQRSFLPGHLRLKEVFADAGVDFDSFATYYSFPHDRNAKVDSLGGSMKRLVEIHLCLHTRALLTILDEPFTHLSPVMQELVCASINQRKRDRMILISDHNISLLEEVCDEFYYLRNGVLKKGAFIFE